jgi:hypothetical protein
MTANPSASASRQTADRIARLPRQRLCYLEIPGYLEIPAADVHKAAAFYENVFRWNIRHRDSSRPSFDDTTEYVSGAWVTGRPIPRAHVELPARNQRPSQGQFGEDKRGFWLRNQMPRFGASLLEFPLEIVQRYLDVEHRHLGRSMAE